MTSILLTGFDPFGGETANPSLEAVMKLEGEIIEGHTVISRVIPTVFGESAAQLIDYVRELNPLFIICVGQAGGRADISIERVSINKDDARIPDNKGNQPIDTEVIANGPVGYWSTLPIKAIVSALKLNGIPSSVSNTAGTFVCNHLFYSLMHELAHSKNQSRGGFVHIPFLPEQVIDRPHQPSMELGTIVTALRIVIEATIKHPVDIAQGGGTTH